MIVSTLIASALIALAPATPVAADPYAKPDTAACGSDLDCFVQYGWRPGSYVDQFLVQRPGDQWVTVTDDMVPAETFARMLRLGYDATWVDERAGIWRPGRDRPAGLPVRRSRRYRAARWTSEPG